MKREKAILPENEEETSEILYGGKHPEWKLIKEETSGIDLDKGIEDKEVILERKSDGKFFKFGFARSNYHGISESGLANDWPLKGEEVFTKTKTIVVYE